MAGPVPFFWYFGWFSGHIHIQGTEVICSGWLLLSCFLFLLPLHYIAAPVIQLHMTGRWMMNNRWNTSAGIGKAMRQCGMGRVNREDGGIFYWFVYQWRLFQSLCKQGKLIVSVYSRLYLCWWFLFIVSQSWNQLRPFQILCKLKKLIQDMSLVTKGQSRFFGPCPFSVL